MVKIQPYIEEKDYIILQAILKMERSNVSEWVRKQAKEYIKKNQHKLKYENQY